MLTSTKSAMRAESTADILSTYHEVFCQYLSTLNPSLEKPTIEELEIDYNHSLEYAITQVGSCGKFCIINQDLNERYTLRRTLEMIVYQAE